MAKTPNLFADDIVLLAPTAPEMQTLLDVTGDWAERNVHDWDLCKCHALVAEGVEEHFMAQR